MSAISRMESPSTTKSHSASRKVGESERVGHVRGLQTALDGIAAARRERAHAPPHLLVEHLVVGPARQTGLGDGFQAEVLVLHGAALGEGQGSHGAVQEGGGMLHPLLALHEDDEGLLGDVLREGGPVAP